MLQQTQAARVVPAYERFLARFPDLQSLTRASAADVLREWGSLGYNRRALNLWRAARALVERGEFPQTPAALQTLPGVGPYTSRAVASFAFGVRCGVVDANVKRVLSRAFGVTGNVQDLADQLAPSSGSGAWNQAMIDLGATVCTARKPLCRECPVRSRCRWAAGERPAGARRPGSQPFETTCRFVRGRIMAELRSSKNSIALRTLERRVGVSSRRFGEALSSLVRDGLVHRARGSVCLGAPTLGGRRVFD